MSESTWHAAESLTDDDRALMAAFVQSPAFGLLRKVVRKQIEVETSLLYQEKDTDEMVRLQGRILGMAMIESLPLIQAHEHKRKVEREQAEAKTQADRAKPRKHPMNQ